MNDALQTFHKKLKSSGHSITRSRETVFLAMLDQEPTSMNKLIKRIDGEVDRASVYRIIEVFEKSGIVERLIMGWKYKLELTDEFNDHHHHLTCLKCGIIIPVEENEELESQIASITLKVQFQPTSHQIEIRGFCAVCRKK